MNTNKSTKVEYMKKKNINFNKENSSEHAFEVISKANDDDNLVLVISINSLVYIEDAEPLTPEGIFNVCKRADKNER